MLRNFAMHYSNLSLMEALLQVVQGEAANILHGQKSTKVAVQVLKDNATHDELVAFMLEILPYK